MKFRFLILAFGLALTLPTVASALDYAIAFSPRTGDPMLDSQLRDVNVFATGSSHDFVDNVVVSFGAPRLLVQDLYVTRRWAPGDIYYACALASMLRRPCGEIVDIYERDHGQGWGVIAQRLGIKPGSAEFHALKGRVGSGHGKLKGRAGKGPTSDGGGKPDMHPAASGGGKGGGQPAGGAQGGKGKGKGKG
jgi:hypothetical protein